MPIEAPEKSPLNIKSVQERSPIWKEHTKRVDPIPNARPTGWLCVENRVLPITEIDLLEIVPGRGLHIRTRHDSWLISLPRGLESDELLRAFTSGEVNCLLGSCEPSDLSSDPSKPSNSASNNANSSVLEYE